MGTIADSVEVEGHLIKLSNLGKLYWPEDKLTKAHLIKYYLETAPMVLPYVYNRPIIMKRYPDGIKGDFFYQKECPSYAPDWVEKSPVRHSSKVINYVICNNIATLIWLASQGCIEIHGWLSRVENIEYPDWAVIDLDPAEGVSFSEVLIVASIVRKALEAFDIIGLPKTSGSKGIHIFIPLKGNYLFEEVTLAMKYLASIIIKAYPDGVTTERNVNRRGNKVYFDYLQNARGKTMAFPYSVRPLPGAPVSTPLTWSEIEKLSIKPSDFNMKSVESRLKKKGDLFWGYYNKKQDLDKLLKVSNNYSRDTKFDYNAQSNL